MYAVVCYFNYRKNQNVEFLKTFSSLSKAINTAKKYASDKYTVIIDHVIIKKLVLDNCILEFTEGTGYEKYVYAVIEIPEMSDQEYKEEDVVHNYCCCDTICVDDQGILYLDHSEDCNNNFKEYSTNYICDQDADTEIDELESEIDELESEIDELESEIDELESEIDELESEIDEVESINDCDMSDMLDMSDMSDMDEIYDDRYDEREDYDTWYSFDCGYEDEGYECCDL
jgi:hypothetical protein